MPISATDYVIHGSRSYIDHDKSAGNRRQLLVSDQTANILSNFLSVFLALAAKNIYNVVRRILRVLNQRNGNRTQEVVTAPASPDGSENSVAEPPDFESPIPAVRIPENTATTASSRSHNAPNTESAVDGEIPPSEQGPRRRQIHRLEIIDKSHDTETMMVIAFRRLFSQAKGIVPLRPLGDNTPTHRRMLTTQFWYDMFKLANESSGDFLWHFVVGLGALLLYFGALLLGIMSTYPVVGDSVAVSQHPHCGIVVSNGSKDDASDFALGKKYYNDIARESRQYAKSCYDLGRGAGGARNPDSCSFFYEPSIKYAIAENSPCPFRLGAGHFCLDGENSAYTLTTGSATGVMADASEIGINSPLRYRFHRSITCSPLKMDKLIYPFFTEDNTLGFRYFYGNRTGDSQCSADLPYCTFEQLVYPDLKRPYSMLTESTHKGTLSKWQPIFNMNETHGQTATLILISNFGISYPSESHDPIFPANKTYGDGWYYNGNYHATALGCMSRTIICTPETAPLECYSPDNPPSIDDSEPEHSAVRALLYFALLPDLSEQLGYLQAEALDAQSQLSGSTSSRLPDDQWKVEVQQIFESLLARTQITARNIARGVVGQELPGQKSLMRPALQGMCSRYKFRAVGWKNISVNRFLAEFIAGLVVCVIGITRENKELWVEEPVRQMAKSRWVKKLCGICSDYGIKALDVLRLVGGMCCLVVCAVRTKIGPAEHGSGATS